MHMLKTAVNVNHVEAVTWLHFSLFFFVTNSCRY